MPSLKDFLFGSSGKFTQTPTLNPNQQQLMNQLNQGLQSPLQGGLGYLSDLYSDDPEAIQRMQAPAMRQFNEQVTPGIAERFSSLGGRNSSAFRNAIIGAGQSLTEQLNAQREGLRSQGLSDLMKYFNQGMQPTFQNNYMPGSPGLAQSLAGGAGQFFGRAGLNYLFPDSMQTMQQQGPQQNMNQGYGAYNNPNPYANPYYRGR